MLQRHIGVTKKVIFLTLLLPLFLILGCASTNSAHVSEQAKKLRDVSRSPAIEGKRVVSSPVEERRRVTDQDLLDSALDLTETSQGLWSKGRLEEAITTLDQAYVFVLQVDTEKNPNLIQQKDDLRFVISKRILEIYASRYTAVNGNHNAIPLIMNEHVQKEIKLFQGRERKFFLESYARSGKYMGMIVKSLKEAGLPEELSWLPLIESGFKVRALSRARALGLWQFIPSTGYKFGLNRDSWIDERLDPEKATAAAIDYLTELHNIFGDWTTVLAAYNCGEGRVLRVIRDQKVNYLDDFWDLYERLPRETARYVPRFLAVLHILDDPAKYGFKLEDPYEPLLYESVKIKKRVHLKEVAKTLDISLSELKELNPELRLQVTPAVEYSVKVPNGKGDVLLAKIDKIPKYSPPERAYAYHRVRKGETLSHIARKYRTSVRAIVRANKIRKARLIRVGQRLKVPLKGGASGKIFASSAKLLPGGKYRIKRGDSLWLIAQKFNTDTKTLQRMNNLRTTRLYVGQFLKVQECAEAC
ncbi:MAG TPA: LysM peptidoglycan-binding domain-containing protein [Nitrospirae bacterium]|nr:membrane-bound lytic murein transglycosylase D precursor [bacterium BMS3Abin10]GBE39670.1 membrane-bound lytic murein transglycosylase D precursor [bacterium BMS3Bbin08]HDH51147.1 LysM peptidoglycan-binding domain-containing protein [Nitrospirota bacterium]HDK41439.1 LysM peptidoglycan-binding domain-containing protein [Nitrospirota bacterium]HDK82291.1 LysM peptidoglycan-binding domain-containing protein [Nitrospirota bacterium]